MTKEMEISVGSFPGFKFSPTEEELILYYLKKKIEGFDKCVEVIAEVDLTQFEPWDLPAKSVIRSDNEWFFFSARGRKYPRGLQSRRATEFGYWKATGKERNVKAGSNIIGTKRTLVFHKGRAPKGERTEWILHEYCMSGTSQDSLVVCRLRRNSEFHTHYSPRKEMRHSSPGESSTSAVAQASTSALADGGPSSALAEGVQYKGSDVSHTEHSSSGNSHSVERTNSECESDHKTASESCHGGCSQQQECDGADDCFADILNDDIIKLDECCLSTPSDLMPSTESSIGIKFKESVQRSTPSMQHSQGTANRRIKLRMEKDIHSLTNREASKAGDETSYEGVEKQKLSPQPPYSLMSALSNMFFCRHGVILLVIISLVVLYLSLLA